MLRYAVGRDPLCTELTALVGELSTLSPVFRARWAAQDVHEHRTGRHLDRGEGRAAREPGGQSRTYRHRGSPYREVAARSPSVRDLHGDLNFAHGSWG
ncbi:hypothetical protein AB0L41_23230 [Amycolatopsis mediterranei]